jgi:hypothetical protein
LEKLTILLAKIGHFALLGEDRKAFFCFGRLPSPVNAGVLEMGRNQGTDDIAGANELASLSHVVPSSRTK